MYIALNIHPVCPGSYFSTALLSLVVSFGICSHYQSKKKKKEGRENKMGGWCVRSGTNVTLAFPVVVGVVLLLVLN